MKTIASAIQNNALEALKAKAPTPVLHAIEHASAKTGVDFAYMLQQAKAESSFDADAKAKTSSAEGLYQFIESTWMSMIDRHGDKHGLQTDGKSREEILEMRNNPETASLMAAELASDNKRFLETHWAKGEKEIGATEMYFAHFMGAGGAASFLKARDDNPMQNAAVLFPDASKANRNVFYDLKTGRAKTLDEVYAFFDKKFSAPKQAPALSLEAPTLARLKSQPQQQNHQFNQIKSSAFVARNTINSNTIAMRKASSPFPRSYAPTSYQSLIASPIELMMLTQLDMPIAGNKKSHLF